MSVTTADFQRPQSATHGMVAITGLGAFLLAIIIVRIYRPFGNNLVNSVLFIVGVTAGVIFLVGMVWQKVHLRPSTGMDFDYDNPSWNRSLYKLAGLFGSFGFIAFFYWIVPQYHQNSYDRYYEMLRIILPPWLILALPYFFLVDRKMREPFDGYWHMGKLVTFQWGVVDSKVIGQHLVGWLIRGFFLPMLFLPMCDDLGNILSVDFGKSDSFSFRISVIFLRASSLFIDAGFGLIGYLMSLRIMDTHIRSIESTTLGWVVALVCYTPFSTILFSLYLPFGKVSWETWLGDTPLFYGIWSIMILALGIVYTWGTVVFGARFANLTHRGIVTDGPFRWTKHPHYVTKNLTWWMTSAPFLMLGTPDEALRQCLQLLGITVIYIMRAKTEERHLSRDPDYVQYALWMEQHGIFRFIKRLPLLHHLSYRAPLQNVVATPARNFISS